MIRRRALLAGAGALAAPAVARGAAGKVLRFVPSEGGVSVLDPVWTTTWPTLPFGLAMFESLYALDDQQNPQPQMAEGHVIEDDGKRWTIRLRDGLRFHDGEPVLARDCVASLRRWMARDSIGRSTLSGRMDALEAADDRTIVFRLKRPFARLPFVLGKPQPNILPIMPARIAATDPNTQIRDMIGSGPFRFVPDEFAAGSLAVQARFEGYVPRNEPPSGAAGGRIARVDRVEWRSMPDGATAANALLTGEIDWLQTPVPDLLEVLRRNKDIVVQAFNPFGILELLRPNHASGPTAKPGVRRAIMAAIDPREVMEAGAGGDPGGWTAPVGAFTPGSAAANSAGMERLGPKPKAEIQAMLREAGYAGEPIVLLHPTDSPTNDAMCQVIARRLADAGMTVDDQIMDSATVATRRTKKDPPEKGGWSLFITNAPGAGHVSPMVAQGYRTGAAAAPGWPDNPEVETLREQWIDAADEAEQRRLTARIQDIVLNDCIEIPLGLHVRKSAWRANVTGILTAPEPLMWNLAKG
jgi:peptide/nickel transport system substrate-binding protein